MIWRTFLHVRFWLVLALASGQLTDDDISRIVDLHNQYRSSVTPPAANMQRMLWNKQLSKVAASYASRCSWGNNPNVSGVVGENLFMTLGPFVVDQPISLWFAENSSYSFTSKTCAGGKECGHYKQIVWANTYFVGCAAHFCSGVSNSKAQDATIFACYYHPPGNIKDESPYTAGSSCSSCSPGTIGCLNNACDRGTNLTLDLPAGVTASLIYPYAGSSSGYLKPSAATLLLAGLTALYIRTT